MAKLRKFSLLLLLLPLLLSGCFFNKKPVNNAPAEPQINYQLYSSQKLNDFYFTAKYLEKWTVASQATGRFKDFKDQATFNGPAEAITVSLLNRQEKKAILNHYNIESQSQTQLNGFLGERILGSLKNNEAAGRAEAVLVENGPYLIVLQTNYPGSPDFVNFLNNFIFAKVKEKVALKSKEVTLKLYFAVGKFNNNECEAGAVKAVTINRPDEDLALIPYAIKLLIQLSSPEDLSRENLVTGIPFNTRLYSFGYEDNKAIVNFSGELNTGGGSPRGEAGSPRGEAGSPHSARLASESERAGGAGSCLMALRRSQIANTLQALSEVSDLRIKNVEIQVEGDAATALQP